MGGSGGRFSITDSEIRRLQEEMAQRLEEEQLDTEVNSFLRRELLAANDRDVGLVNRHLDEIQGALRDRVEEFDRLLFGGSIAKHTYVEGLSDVDSLVIL